MPYTPPAPRSPAATSNNSPMISRQHSYFNNADLAASHAPSTQRPRLPRSVSSTSYLQKHRRTPSISDHKADEAAPVKKSGSVVNGKPRPVHEHLSSLLSGIGGTSNESPPSSDEDRGRAVDRPMTPEQVHQIEEALSKLSPWEQRALSPTRDADAALSAHADGSVSAPMPGSPTRTTLALSAEARKISHSRSSSETYLAACNRLDTDVAIPQSSDDSDEDDLMIKPPLLRKKSGELVKPALRPASRRRPSSMPGTPTYSKAVHFNENIEQVRHFLQVDRPIAVSTGTSPVETYDSETDFPFGDDGYPERKSHVVEWEMKTSNFPRDTLERKSMPVRVERIFLSSDNKTLVGTVAVANIAFHKAVVARFTLDYWKTTSEVVAEYNNDVRRKQANDGCDRFNFNIKLADQANLQSKTLLLCVRYIVNGQEYWDNNSNMNYQVDFIKKAKQNSSAQANKGGMQAGSLGAIPRSRHSPSAGGRNARTQPGSPDDDFGRSFDNTYQFGVGRVNLESPNNTIRLKSHHRQSRKGSVFPAEAHKSTANGAGQSLPFSTRYDFSASLSAALSNAQQALGERSGIKPKVPAVDSNAPPATPAPTPADGAVKAPALVSPESRPGLQSAEYNDLIQKYCFFGSNNGSTTNSPATNTPEKVPSAPTSAPEEFGDGTVDANVHSYNSSATSSANSSNQSSGSASPTVVGAGLDGSADARHHSRTPSNFSNRSASPASFGITARSGSPVPYSSPWGDSMLGEVPGMVASHG